MDGKGRAGEVLDALGSAHELILLAVSFASQVVTTVFYSQFFQHNRCETNRESKQEYESERDHDIPRVERFVGLTNLRLVSIPNSEIPSKFDRKQKLVRKGKELNKLDFL
jgi:hypothetical protein